jgi:hypothetical protein
MTVAAWDTGKQERPKSLYELMKRHEGHEIILRTDEFEAVEGYCKECGTVVINVPRYFSGTLLMPMEPIVRAVPKDEGVTRVELVPAGKVVAGRGVAQPTPKMKTLYEFKEWQRIMHGEYSFSFNEPEWIEKYKDYMREYRKTNKISSAPIKTMPAVKPAVFPKTSRVETAWDTAEEEEK